MVRQRGFPVEAVTFDVFGTLVDWRSGIIEAGKRIEESSNIRGDWAALADDWRSRYRPALERVNRGERAWGDFTEIHRETLEPALARLGITGLDEQWREELVGAWSRLPPWPDSAPGLDAVRRTRFVATLSNGHGELLTTLAKRAGLRFNTVLSAEQAGVYKPAPAVYHRAAGLLELPIERVLMVAAHPYDLRAARQAGMRTAYVPRPLEWGPEGPAPEVPDDGFDLVATDVLDLAEQLG